MNKLFPIKDQTRPQNLVSEVLIKESEQQCLELEEIPKKTFNDRKWKQFTFSQMNQNEEQEIIVNKSSYDTVQVYFTIQL